MVCIFQVIEARKPRHNNAVYNPKPKKGKKKGDKAQSKAANETPVSDVNSGGPSFEAGKGLPDATNEIQFMDNANAANYMQVPNYGFETCIPSSIMDNVLNFPNPIDNNTSLIYNDMNFPNDFLFNVWEPGTSSNQSVPSFQNMSFDDIVKGM